MALTGVRLVVSLYQKSPVRTSLLPFAAAPVFVKIISRVLSVWVKVAEAARPVPGVPKVKVVAIAGAAKKAIARIAAIIKILLRIAVDS